MLMDRSTMGFPSRQSQALSAKPLEREERFQNRPEV